MAHPDTPLPHPKKERTFELRGSSPAHDTRSRSLPVMKLTAALGALALAACGPAAVSAPEPLPCEPKVPPTAQHPIAIRPVLLAGEYQLIQVPTQPASSKVKSGRLHLAPLDSAARTSAIGRPVADLVGWLEPSGTDTTGRSAAASRDLEHPGVLLSGEHLRLGDVGAVDGYIEDLTITAVAPDGFWGWWRAHSGWEITIDSSTGRVLPDPTGYFCALRRDSGR
jgi:hypothetical protein